MYSWSIFKLYVMVLSTQNSDWGKNGIIRVFHKLDKIAIPVWCLSNWTNLAFAFMSETLWS